MIVVDASVLVSSLIDDDDSGDTARHHLAADRHWSGPEHLLLEAFSAVRGRCLGGKLSLARAQDAVAVLGEVSIGQVATSALLPRMWELRHNVTGYDAAYVAAAEAQGCALVTADARLARVDGVRCPVRLALPER